MGLVDADDTVGAPADGLLVTQSLNMFHYQGSHNHAGGLVARTVVRIPQALVVFLLYLVPRRLSASFTQRLDLLKHERDS